MNPILAKTYLFSLLIVDGDFDIVEALKEEVDVPESVQVHHHLQDCSQRHYKIINIE